MRRRAQVRGKEEPIVRIHDRMFFDPPMRVVFFNRPVGIKVPVRFFSVAFFQLVFRSFYLFLEILELIFGNRPADRFDQPGIHSNPLVDGQTMLLELKKKVAVNFDHSLFAQTAAES